MSELYAQGEPDADVSAAMAEALSTMKAFVAVVERLRDDVTVEQARQVRLMGAAVEFDMKVLRRAIDDALNEVAIKGWVNHEGRWAKSQGGHVAG